MHGTSAGVPVPITTYGGLVTLARSEALPEGASPRTYNTDFLVGLVKTRPGLTSVYTYAGETVGPNAGGAAASTGWANPTNVLSPGQPSSILAEPVNTATVPLNVTSFGFNISAGVTGVLVTIANCYTSPNVIPVTLSVQLLINGVAQGNIFTVTLPNTATALTFGGLGNSWGLPLTAATLNNTAFGLQITALALAPGNKPFYFAPNVYVGYVTVEAGLTVGGSNFNFISTFTAQNGDVKNLSMDAGGNLWVEDVTNNPGILTLALGGITPNSYGVGVNGPDVEYLAISNGRSGSDIPLQYTPNWIDKITQVGPGAAPTFTPSVATDDTFAITGITQYPANSDITDPGNLSVLLQSTGPGSTAPGNVITVYYSPGFYDGAPKPEAEDMTLVNAFNAGNAVYVYISGADFGNGTYLVTSVGNALPPGVDHYRYYFTVQTTNVAYQLDIESPGQYQMSVAIMTTTAPVPGLQVGNDITISGATPSAWNGTWPISQALNSGTLAITETSVTGSVATYTYAVVSGAAPVAGQLVTITGTDNANGALNGANLTIASSTGGSTGTFTIAVPVVSAAATPEDGQATTAGTIFAFDPGVGTVGTSNDPIFGNTTVGGSLTFIAGDAQLISPGTRQGSVIFITRNGYYTAPAPPVTFTCPENTTAILATNIPIGPPNVIARGIILTEAGDDGVPGANFFTIPTPVQYIVNNVTYVASALIINDNVSTSASFSFTDAVLLNALAVDVYAYNLFNQIEIGDPGWVISYDSRNFYGLCRNKVQNFNNLSFDGGYLPANQLVPLGWSQPDLYGSLVASPKFGDAYYIQNTSGSTLTYAGYISQSAYQDAYLVPIIQPNTGYSLRISARVPSGNTTGNLGINLTAFGTLTTGGAQYGQFRLPFSSMTTAFATYEGPLLDGAFIGATTVGFGTVPPSLLLEVFAFGIAAGADVEIDRIEIFPTAIPILTTTVYGSYAGLPEQVDAVTGQVIFTSENQEPVNGAVVMYDTFYALKGTLNGSSLYSLQASSGLEPAQWSEPEVAQKSGAIGILAYDFGEQWIVMANRNGVYLFDGGQPKKISHEIFQVWDAINWSAAGTIWIKNDVIHRRLMVGIPLPTPNFWLPNAPVNTSPTSPNVIAMLNYQGLESGTAIQDSPQMHTTMFGALAALDMRRKWSLWQIPCPFANQVQTSIDEEMYLCNGKGNSKIYALNPDVTTDDGAIIDSLYTTAGLIELTKRGQMQGMTSFRARWGYLVAALESLGTIAVRLLPNRLLGPTDSTAGYNAWMLPGGFTPGSPALNDAEASLNFVATRTFVEFRENDGYGFSLSNLVMHAKKDPWNAVRGAK